MTDYKIIKKLGLRILDAGDNYGPIDVVSAEELEEKLSQAVRVYSSSPLTPEEEGAPLAWDGERCNADTHSAILLCVEELPKEKCSPHTPSTHRTKPIVSRGPLLDSLYGCSIVCSKCGIPMRAEWKAEGES